MAWLSSSAAGRTKSAAGKPIQRAAGRKITPSAAISLLFSLGFRSSRLIFARAALVEQHLPPLVVHKGLREGESTDALLQKRLCCFSFLRGGGDKRGRATPPPPPTTAPNREGAQPAARRSPFGGGAGGRLPCPNGALLEKNGRVARREEAAGASRWGLGSENRPSGQWALNMGPPWPGI